jgi:2-haloacid dehalogenase
MLDAAVRNSGLQGIFEPHLSTGKVRAYKPDPRAYQMGIDAFGVKHEEIAVAAFGGWDPAGAKGFGYPTFWVNRTNLPLEELGFCAGRKRCHLARPGEFCRPRWVDAFDMNRRKTRTLIAIYV